MAVPFLFTLPLSARAAFPFIQSGVRRGMSSRQIESVIRNAGLPISRTRSILPIMRRLQQIEQHGQNIRFTPKQNRIRTDLLPESLTRIPKRFSFNLRLRGIDEFGDTVERFITLVTDQVNPTPEFLENTARRNAVTGPSGSGLTDIEVTLQSGIRRGVFEPSN